MSHVVTIRTEIRDAEAVRAACRRLAAPAPVYGNTRLYRGEFTGLAVKLCNWRYPVVCDLATGRVHYDNFAGHWGKAEELDRFVQAYACEKAKIEARRQGHQVTESSQKDGSIRLTIQVAGGEA